MTFLRRRARANRPTTNITITDSIWRIPFWRRQGCVGVAVSKQLPQVINLFRPRDSATLEPMKTLRLILTLLLCLTVPVAGWASALSGPMCPQLQHVHGAPQLAAPHSERMHPAASGTNESGHRHDHCGGLSTHDKSCKGDYCACGCGMGSCSSSQLLSMTLQPADFMLFAGKGLLPQNIESAFLVARATSPLRPPIL